MFWFLSRGECYREKVIVHASFIKEIEAVSFIE
jgi:hypothetical protein